MNWNDEITILDKIYDWVLTYMIDVMFIGICLWVVMFVLTFGWPQ